MLDVIVVGVADGHEVFAVHPRHGRQMLGLFKAPHLLGKSMAVDFVGRDELETAAEDVAAGPVVVVDQGNARLFAGVGGHWPDIFTRLLVFWRQQMGRVPQPIGAAHLLA